MAIPSSKAAGRTGKVENISSEVAAGISKAARRKGRGDSEHGKAARRTGTGAGESGKAGQGVRKAAGGWGEGSGAFRRVLKEQ